MLLNESVILSDFEMKLLLLKEIEREKYLLVKVPYYDRCVPYPSKLTIPYAYFKPTCLPARL